MDDTSGVVTLSVDKPQKERKNKSQEKREMLALRELGKQLVALSHAELENIPLPQTVHQAVIAAQKLKRAALKRQYQYIEGCLRNVDVGLIRLSLEEINKPKRKVIEDFHEAEQWRDDLLAGDKSVLEGLLARFVLADRQRLQQLIRNALREQARNKPPKSARRLFQYLTELQQTE